jgi:uncharacterized protein (DUF934 family)
LAEAGRILARTLETQGRIRHMLAVMTASETEQSAPPAPRLWTPEGFREDEWRHADSAEALAGNGRFILPLQVFLDLDPVQRHSARERLGVLLLPADPVEKVVPLLDDLSLVALAFPAFNDGRSFSKAELLRSRHGFRRAIRATGQVLVDQLPHMLRLGFDEFEVSHPVLLSRLEKGEIGGIPLYYQPTAKPEDGPAEGANYSWRRSR